MANHPNRSRVKTAASNPTPESIAAARASVGHTQREASSLVYSALRTWQSWEMAERPMPASVFELYLHKAGIQQIPFNQVT
jgi:hypothetical protein